MRRFREKKPKAFTTTRIIAFGFLGAILVGTFLLMLPISTTKGNSTSFLDALFTATTSICVTGLVTVPTFSHWTIFGQGVIVLLIQVGGLGVITFTMLFFLALRKKIGMKERLLIRDAYNLDTIQGLVVLVKRIVIGTLWIEGIGALLYMIVFIPKFGIGGVWKSIFNAVSAFCNAGMDILGPVSLEEYVSHPLINITTMVLIILGGIGFPVWWNVVDMVKNGKKKYLTTSNVIRHLKLHTKLVIGFTLVLIISGALLIFLLEYDNPQTLGRLTFCEKIWASLFQSVTTRTAGFATISQSGLRGTTVLVCCIWMFIGGSPSGTAGGVKTTTVVVLALTVYSIIRGRRDTEVMGKKISDETVRKALSIFTISFLVFIISFMSLSIVQQGSLLDCLYETMSAIGTVGLSRDFTASLNPIGKLIIIVTMYLGRIGPISLALFFNAKRYVNLKTYPEEHVGVG